MALDGGLESNLIGPRFAVNACGLRRLKSEEAVPDRDAERLDRKIDRIADELPERAGGVLRWLREPSSRWVRIPIALLLILGGILAFLPVLGLWMIPLGLLFLAQDVPFLQRPILQALTWLERKWIALKRRL